MYICTKFIFLDSDAILHNVYVHVQLNFLKYSTLESLGSVSHKNVCMGFYFSETVAIVSLAAKLHIVI